MGFGSVEDLKPLVDRLDSDAGFANETASMVRTIIYQERDGLSRLELIELIEKAVGGPKVEDAAGPEMREAVRRLMAFVESVFRTRRNPGGVSVDGADQLVTPEAEHQERKEPMVAAAAESARAEHPKVDMFYRARMVAQDEGEEAFVEERRVESAEKRENVDDAIGSEMVLHPDLHWHVPFEDFEDRETAERGSPAWLWVAGICALMLAFCAGLFVHQRLLVPLRAPNTPYEAAPPEAPTSGSQQAGMANGAAKSAGRETADPRLTSGPVGKPSAAEAPVSDVTQLPKYMAPATIGASPAVMQAHLMYAPRATYPMMAEMTRTQGPVTVEAVVGKSGRVIRAQAISGHHLLRGAAVREVIGRRYRPYTVNGRPVNVATMVTIDFRLRR